MKRRILPKIGFAVLALLVTTVWTQSGGQFVIEKSVISGGGGRSAGGLFSLDGTAGQPLAGTVSGGGTFALAGGFWGGGVAAISFVTISGQVFTATGQGLRNATVVLTDPLGVRRTVFTSSLGFYSFSGVQSGQTYDISVLSKRFRFQTRNLAINSDLTDVNFVGIE